MGKSEFRGELERLINRHSIENGSNTPDFILADYLCACLEVFEAASRSREKWYGCAHSPWQHEPNDDAAARPAAPKEGA